ncbi:MAG: alpha/beta hydrolase [Rhodospirillales bacterium]|nr:alpha/beta hydrolase [Rhodospirillales bacterium]
MSMRERSYLSLGAHGFHRIAYAEWGAPDQAQVAICVHGLTRNGRDFDCLAQALEDRYRVACPDLPGRGKSHWFTVRADYKPPVYLSDMAALIARMDVPQVDWIGTSLGGILGMTLAAQPNTPIRKLVVNDVGTFIDKAALARISDYVGQDPSFRSLEALEAYLREVHAPFGALTDAQWRHLAIHSARRDEAADVWRLHYDPGLVEPLKEWFSEDVDLWPVWEAITCPVLILRGAESDILLNETAEEMLTRGPEAELVVLPDIGHAPMLMDPAQIAVVRDWLLS